MRERCSASVGTDTFELSPDQAGNAALIAAIAVERGLPARAVSIALATAIQESGLRNLDHGDRAGPDSRGLFQQRPSQGWGSAEQVMDPVYAAGAFYDALVKVPGYETLPLTEAAQTVQRSAYPAAYADHEAEGRAFASALTGHSPAALNCVLREASASTDIEAARTAIEEAFGAVETGADGGELGLRASGTRGWAAAAWGVANARTLGIAGVSFGGLEWVRAERSWRPAGTDTGLVTFTTLAPPAAAQASMRTTGST